MLAEHIDTLKRLPSVHLSKNGSLGAAIIPSGQLQIYVTLPQNCTAGLILLLLLARLCVLVLLLHLESSIDGCLLYVIDKLTCSVMQLPNHTISCIFSGALTDMGIEHCTDGINIGLNKSWPSHVCLFEVETNKLKAKCEAC